MKTLTKSALSIFQCPESNQSLEQEQGKLVSKDRQNSYPVTTEGILCFLNQELPISTQIQQAHYDRIASEYVRNLEFPHTQEYQHYLDQAFLELIDSANLGITGELCCGAGEAAHLVNDKVDQIIGIDVSLNMLTVANGKPEYINHILAQGDVTDLPLKDNSIDSVIMIGGIHHIQNRQKLFSQVFRVLKPGGKFYFREPVSDFFIWKWLREIIYRISPALDANTEEPLYFESTRKTLEAEGLILDKWKTYGFFGFCIFMNSDVLIFNRLFRFIPFIRNITRTATKLDDFITSSRLFSRRGLIVVGAAHKDSNNEVS